MKKVIMFCLLAIFFLHGSAFGSFNFIDNGDGTVTDGRTGLVWLKNANPWGYMNWYDAGTYCSSLASEQTGLTDGSTAGQWHLPTIQELEGIGTDPPLTWESGSPPITWTMPGTPFTNVQQSIDMCCYWSGTSWVSNTDFAWVVNMNFGIVGHNGKNGNDYVWPVREPTTTTTTTTICDADYWKTLYEQCQAQLTSTTTTTVQPTNIELSILDATPSDKQVILKWQTETETDNVGFNVWRADNFVKINNAIIPALGSSVLGSDYDFVDQWVLNGKRYFYLLEDIDTKGISTFHGPVKATPRWIYGVGK